MLCWKTRPEGVRTLWGSGGKGPGGRSPGSQAQPLFHLSPSGPQFPHNSLCLLLRVAPAGNVDHWPGGQGLPREREVMAFSLPLEGLSGFYPPSQLLRGSKEGRELPWATMFSLGYDLSF